MAISVALRQVITCSGAYADGSLRVVRNGVGLSEHARVEMPGVKEMWAMHSPSRKHPCLAVSFVTGTHCLTSLVDDELAEADTPTPSKYYSSSSQDLTLFWQIEISGFDQNLPSLLCASLPCGFIQVPLDP